MRVAFKPKFIPLVQKPSCCNVTCLQMILYRRGFGLFDQQEMAKFFNIKVAKKEQRSFNVKLGTYTQINKDGGLKTVESERVINKFFKTNKIPLFAKSVLASEISDLGSFIVDNIKNNNDLWMEYKSHEIHGEKFIHDNVVESLQKKNGRTTVTLVDPAPEYKPRLEVSVTKLRKAISNEFGRETGFIVVSSYL